MAKDGGVAVWFQPLRLANAELLERHLYQVADAVIEASFIMAESKERPWRVGGVADLDLSI